MILADHRRQESVMIGTMIGEAIPLARPSIEETDITAVLEVLSTPTLSMGPKVRAFERAVAEHAGVAEGVAVNSGTSGLHLCLAALGVGPGDEVITTPFSFVASANCALYQGATPVFVDIDPQTLTIDPHRIEAAITPRTRAILPVDVFGQPAAAEALDEIGRAHDIPIIYDACEAIGAERNGRRSGSWGRAAVFAFYPNKQITTGEGGMIVTDDPEYARVLRSLCNQGRDDNGTWTNHVRLGYNYRLDEMSAALGVSQMTRIDVILARRAQVAAWYAERLANVEGLALPYVAPETTRMSWFVYVVQIDETVGRDRVMANLAAEGIPSRPYFVPIHLQPLYRNRFGFQSGDFPITEQVARTTLALPFFTDMSEGQVDCVCARIRYTIEVKFNAPLRK
jgi:perosamine synthetase